MLNVTATDLPRVLACNGSVKVEAFESSLEADDVGRKEGDAAHWLIEQVHKHGQPLEGMVNKQAPNGVFITADMVDHVSEFLGDVAGIGTVEFDTSFQDAGAKWRVGGRADHLHQGGGCLVVRDFKYGWRIVEVEMNYTLLWHAVGFLLRARSMGIEYPSTHLSVFEFIIYQPRPYHHKGTKRRWILQRGDLMRIWEKMEAILENPNDQLNTGGHCYKCPAMVNCPAFRKAQNSAIEASGQAFTDTLNNEALSTQLAVCARAAEVLKQMNDALEDLAKHRLSKGEIIPDYAIERSMGNREWKKDITPEFLKMVTGKDLAKQKLITPAQAEKLGVSPELVASFSGRDPKGFNLVRADADTQGRKMFNQKEGA